MWSFKIIIRVSLQNCRFAAKNLLCPQANKAAGRQGYRMGAESCFNAPVCCRCGSFRLRQWLPYASTESRTTQPLLPSGTAASPRVFPPVIRTIASLKCNPISVASLFCFFRMPTPFFFLHLTWNSNHCSEVSRLWRGSSSSLSCSLRRIDWTQHAVTGVI